MAVGPPPASGAYPPQPEPPPLQPAAGYAVSAGGSTPAEDRHWILDDEYFVQSGPLVQGWAWVYLAKMKQPPSPETKGKALFFYVQDGSEESSDLFHRTRPAGPADFAAGSLLLCFMQNSRGDVNYAPATKDEARGGGPRWFIGRVTDTSSAGHGYLTLAAGRRCATDTLRAIVR
jgi:hypothetical protein